MIAEVIHRPLLLSPNGRGWMTGLELIPCCPLQSCPNGLEMSMDAGGGSGGFDLPVQGTSETHKDEQEHIWGIVALWKLGLLDLHL